MQQTRNEHVLEIQRLAIQITRLCEKVLGESDVVAEPLVDIEEKLKNRVCLQCGKVVGPDERYSRGLCSADYQGTLVKLKAHEITENEIVAAGLMAPSGKGGRPRERRSSLEQLIESRSRTIEKGKELEAYKAQQKMIEELGPDEAKKQIAKFLIKKNEELSKKTEKPKPKKEPK